jgi:hypothetical protein
MTFIYNDAEAKSGEAYYYIRAQQQNGQRRLEFSDGFGTNKLVA